MQANNHRKIGADYEQQAVKFFQQQGFDLLAKNFHCRTGEIDLIVHDQKNLLFIEVKYRRSNDFGNVLETVTASKQRKLLKCAEYFLLKNQQLINLNLRFDVVVFAGDQPANWIKNAIGGW